MAKANDKKTTPPKKKKPVDSGQYFKPGNRFWEARSTHGRDTIFENAETMLDAAKQYFVWCEENPIWEAVLQNGVIHQVPKMRAMTMAGLCIYLEVNTRYFAQFKNAVRDKLIEYQTLKDKGQLSPDQENDVQKQKDFSTVIDLIEDSIWQQKFTGAAAGQLNANIISRDLGMLDKREIDHKSSDGTAPAQVVVFRIPDNNRGLPSN